MNVLVTVNRHAKALTVDVGEVVFFVAEPKNEHDREAVKVEVFDFEQGKSVFYGYVANSVNTVIRGTSSAGAIARMVGSKVLSGKVLLVLQTQIVVEVEFNE